MNYDTIHSFSPSLRNLSKAGQEVLDHSTYARLEMRLTFLSAMHQHRCHFNLQLALFILLPIIYDSKDTSFNRSRQELRYIAELSRARWSCRLKAKAVVDYIDINVDSVRKVRSMARWSCRLAGWLARCRLKGRDERWKCSKVRLTDQEGLPCLQTELYITYDTYLVTWNRRSIDRHSNFLRENKHITQSFSMLKSL